MPRSGHAWAKVSSASGASAKAQPNRPSPSLWMRTAWPSTKTRLGMWWRKANAIRTSFSFGAMRCGSGVSRLARPSLPAEDAEAVQPTVAAQAANYHQRRFAELEGEGLVPAAAAVARLFADAPAASNQDVDAALATVGFNDAGERYAQREALNRLGYIWRPPNQQAPFRWYPGIPSLMTYVLKEAV